MNLKALMTVSFWPVLHVCGIRRFNFLPIIVHGSKHVPNKTDDLDSAPVSKQLSLYRRCSPERWTFYVFREKR